jgi:RHS repeat-associated protein
MQICTYLYHSSLKSSSALVILGVCTVAGAQVPPPPVSPAPVVDLEYDARGNFTKAVQAKGQAGYNFATGHDYDSLSRRFKTTDARGKPIGFVYDGRENLVQVTDPRGLVTTYPRNGLGDAIGLASPDTGSAVHTVDAAGNLKTRVDSRGVLATYDYDALNRLNAITYSQTGQTSQVFKWTYDQTGPGFSYGVGRLTSTQFPVGSATYAYDAFGRLIGSTQTVTSGSTVILAVGYGYDTAGHITSITYPSGRVLSIPHSGGQPTGMSLAPNGSGNALPLLNALQFEPAPGETGVARSWNWQLSGGTIPNARVFDIYGRMIRYPLGGAVRDVIYDPADRIVRYTHWNAASGSAVPVLDQSFGYDELGRLIGIATSQGNWTLSYDDNGNRFAVTTNGTNGSNTRSYATNPANNWLMALNNPARSFGYDTSGNTVSDVEGIKSISSSIDLAGRVAGVNGIVPEFASDISSAYSYNSKGLRVLKQSAVVGNFIYVYDQEGQLLGEYKAQDGSVVREYIWLQGIPVAIVDGSAVNASVYYIQTDHLNTPRTVIDRTGVQRWTWMAEPFGNNTPVENPVGFGAFQLDLRMPGQYFDVESGLTYNWNRTYDSGVGRFTQSDPVGLAGGINTYAYVNSAPVLDSDPNGLLPMEGLIRSRIRPVPVGIGPVGPPAPIRDPDFPPGVGPNQLSTSSGAGTGQGTATSSVGSDQCPPACDNSPPRSQAAAAAYSWAGIPIGGAGASPIPWSNLNMPSGMSKGGREFGEFMRTYYPKNYGYSTAGGAMVVEHPFGHPDQPGPVHHACPHFHAKNATGVEKIFIYKPGS